MLIPGRLQVEKRATLTGHQGAVYTLAQGPEPYSVLSCGGDGHLAEWDLRNPGLGRLVARVPSTVFAMHFDAESGLICLGQNQEGLQWIDLKAGKPAASLQLGKDSIFFIEKIGSLYLAGLSGGELAGVEMDGKPRIRFRIRLSSDRLRTGLWLPGLNLFAIGGTDGRIRLVDIDKGQDLQEIQAHKSSVFALAPDPEGRWLLSAGRDAHIHAYSLQKAGQMPFLSRLHDIPAHLYAINHLALKPDGTMLASCSMDKAIKIWDPQNLQLIKVIDKARHAGHGTSVNRMLWARFDDLLVTCSDDRTLSVWHLSAERT